MACKCYSLFPKQFLILLYIPCIYAATYSYIVIYLQTIEPICVELMSERFIKRWCFTKVDWIKWRCTFKLVSTVSNRPLTSPLGDCIPTGQMEPSITRCLEANKVWGRLIDPSFVWAKRVSSLSGFFLQWREQFPVYLICDVMEIAHITWVALGF